MLLYGLIILLYLTVNSAEGQSRNIARSGEFGDVNLVEFNIRGVTYGRCTFTEDGEELELLYEDRSGEISAKSMNPTVADPISKTQICRDVATRPVPSSNQFRTSIGDSGDYESTEDLQGRFDKFQQKLESTEVYLSYLKPRFIGDMMNNIGILVGGQGGHFSGIGVHLPQNSDNKNNVNLHLGGFKPFGWGR